MSGPKPELNPFAGHLRRTLDPTYQPPLARDATGQSSARRAPSTTRKDLHYLRNLVAGIGGEAAKAPGQIADLARHLVSGLVNDGPAIEGNAKLGTIRTTAAPTMGQAIKPVVDRVGSAVVDPIKGANDKVGNLLADVIGGGPATTELERRARGVGEPIGNLLGWEGAIRAPGAIAKILRGARAGEAAVRAPSLLEQLASEGGATLEPSGAHFAGSGYAVADPALTSIVKSPEEMQAFLARPDVQDALTQGAKIGKWTDPATGATEINISNVVPDKDAAIALARSRNEKAIGHLENGAYQGDIANPHYLEPIKSDPRTIVQRPVPELPPAEAAVRAQTVQSMAGDRARQMAVSRGEELPLEQQTPFPESGLLADEGGAAPLPKGIHPDAVRNAEARVELVPTASLLPYREFDRDPAKVAALAKQIEADGGIKEPLTLDYSTQGRHARLTEGNHRLAAAQQLGYEYVPVQGMTRTRPFTTRAGSRPPVPVPGVDEDQFGYIASHLHPSEIAPDLGAKPMPSRKAGFGGAGILGGMTAGGAAGATIGGQVGDTPDERFRNSLFGLGAGMIGGGLLGHGAIGELTERRVGRGFPDAASVGNELGAAGKPTITPAIRVNGGAGGKTFRNVIVNGEHHPAAYEEANRSLGLPDTIENHIEYDGGHRIRYGSATPEQLGGPGLVVEEGFRIGGPTGRFASREEALDWARKQRGMIRDDLGTRERLRRNGGLQAENLLASTRGAVGVPGPEGFGLNGYIPPQEPLVHGRGARTKDEDLTEAFDRALAAFRAGGPVEPFLQAGRAFPGAAPWYSSTRGIYRDAADVLGESRAAEEVNKLLGTYMPSVTAMSDPYNNLRRSLLWKALADQGIITPQSLVGEKWPANKIMMPEPFGHIAQKTHQAALARAMETGVVDPVANPKPASFGQDLTGNMEPATFDTVMGRIARILDPKLDRFFSIDKTGSATPKPWAYQPLSHGLAAAAHDAAGRGLLEVEPGLSPVAGYQSLIWHGGTDSAEQGSMYDIFDRLRNEAAQQWGVSPTEANRLIWAEGKVPHRPLTGGLLDY